MTAYHVSRNGKTLGVYSEPDAKDYYAQGRIGPDDRVWTEGMASWVAATELFGPAPQAEVALDDAPAMAPLAPVAPGSAMPEASPPEAAASQLPPPPKLHWGLLVLFTVLTFGVFYVVWMFIQSAWVRKIDPQSKATPLLAIYTVLVLGGQVLAEASGEGTGGAAVGTLLVLAGSVVSIVGFFSMRRSMLGYYNKTEPIGLRLSGVLTFFLSAFYLQYHMARIARWKETGVLPL